MRRAAPRPKPDRLPASPKRAPPCIDSACYPRKLVRAGCLERVKTALAEMRNRRWSRQRRLPSIRLDRQDSSEFALLLVAAGLGQARVGIDRLGDTRRHVALALVEEGGAAQAVLQRHRRVVGARPAICALDPT